MDIQSAQAINVYERSGSIIDLHVQSQTQSQSAQQLSQAKSVVTDTGSSARAEKEKSPVEEADRNKRIADETQRQKEKIEPKALKKELEKANDFLNQFSLSLRFDENKEFHELYVSLVDAENGKVIKKFPPEEYVKMRERLKEYLIDSVKESEKKIQ